ncbi:MAG: hypothetical protein AB1791_03065 [Chloroflexota bacterium]
METVLAALIVVTFFLFAVLTFSHTYLSGQDSLQLSWREMEERLGERSRTDLTPVSNTTLSNGSVIELTIQNDGDTKLADFDQWDVMVQYYQASGNYEIVWLPYVTGEPANNEWTVAGIYLDAATLQAEIFEPDVLNPGEEMVARVRVSPPVGPSTTNLAAVSTPNGVSVTTLFTR